MAYGLGAILVIVGLALARWGGRAISRQGKLTADPRIWGGSALAAAGGTIVVVRSVIWLIAG
jgi:hypothetical protein